MKEKKAKIYLIGILRYCSIQKIPGDGEAFKKALFKLHNMYDDFFDNMFDKEGKSNILEDVFDEIIFEGLLGITGSRLENIVIDQKLIKLFDNKLANKLSVKEIDILKKMGEVFPRLLKKNESVRYKRLVS